MVINRVEGNGLASAPSTPQSAVFLELVSSDPADTGEVRLELVKAGYLREVVHVQLTGTTPVFTTVKAIQMNHAIYESGDANIGPSPPAGTITIKHGSDVLGTLMPTDISPEQKAGCAWVCAYTLDVQQVARNPRLKSVTPGFQVYHRLGYEPYTVTPVGVGGLLGAVGTLWAEGTGFCQFVVEH